MFFIVVGLLVFFSLLLVRVAVHLAILEGNGNNPEVRTSQAVNLVKGRP